MDRLNVWFGFNGAKIFNTHIQFLTINTLKNFFSSISLIENFISLSFFNHLINRLYLSIYYPLK